MTGRMEEGEDGRTEEGEDGRGEDGGGAVSVHIRFWLFLHPLLWK